MYSWESLESKLWLGGAGVTNGQGGLITRVWPPQSHPNIQMSAGDPQTPGAWVLQMIWLSSPGLQFPLTLSRWRCCPGYWWRYPYWGDACILWQHFKDIFGEKFKIFSLAIFWWQYLSSGDAKTRVMLLRVLGLDPQLRFERLSWVHTEITVRQKV